MPARPRLARVRGLRFTSADLMAVREALRATATALAPLGTRDHRYIQHGYRARGTLPAEELVLAAERTWGRPNRMDFVWYERTAPLEREVSAAARAFRSDPDAVDARPGAERDAVRAHVEAILAAVRSRPELRLLTTSCGWGDEPGARVRGIAIVDPRTQELYWTYLIETWPGP